MNTFELIEKLADKPKNEIKYALMILMQKRQRNIRGTRETRRIAYEVHG